MRRSPVGLTLLWPGGPQPIKEMFFHGFQLCLQKKKEKEIKPLSIRSSSRLERFLKMNHPQLPFRFLKDREVKGE